MAITQKKRNLIRKQKINNKLKKRSSVNKKNKNSVKSKKQRGGNNKVYKKQRGGACVLEHEADNATFEQVANAFVVHVKGQTKYVTQDQINIALQWLERKVQQAKLMKAASFIIVWDGDEIIAEYRGTPSPNKYKDGVMTENAFAFTSVLSQLQTNATINAAILEGYLSLVYCMSTLSPYDPDPPKGLEFIPAPVFRVVYDHGNLNTPPLSEPNNATNTPISLQLGMHIKDIANFVQTNEFKLKDSLTPIFNSDGATPEWYKKHTLKQVYNGNLFGYFLLGAGMTEITKPHGIVYLGLGEVGAAEAIYQTIPSFLPEVSIPEQYLIPNDGNCTQHSLLYVPDPQETGGLGGYFITTQEKIEENKRNLEFSLQNMEENM